MSNTSRQSFLFYESFQDAIDLLPDADQLAVYRAIANFSLRHQEPQLEGSAQLVWVLIRPQLEANWRKYEKGCKGGAPKGNFNACKNNKTTQNNLKQPNDNVNVNENDNDNGNGNTIETTTTTTPTLESIRDYIATNSLNVDAQQFHDYYTANGWRLGKNPMADWQATLRNWSRRPDTLSEQQTQQTQQTQNTTLKITLCDDL